MGKRTVCIGCFLLGSASMLHARWLPVTKSDDENLNGRVSQLVETVYGYTAATGEDSLKCGHRIVYLFDKEGLKTEEIQEDQRFTYDYNEDGVLRGTVSYDSKYHKKEIIKACSNRYYDGSGNLTKSILNFSPSDSIVTSYFDYFMTTYMYDEHDHVIEKKEIQKHRDSKKERVTEWYKYIYDSLGNKIREEELSDNTVTEKTEYTYSKGRLIETLTWQWFEGEDLYIRNRYEYNDDGTLDLHTNTVYNYGSQVDISNISQEEYSYKYDITGRLTEESVHTSFETGEFMQREYTTVRYADFDDNNNWRRKLTDNNGIKSLTIREFHYYD